jgi:hypothetical protein
LLTSLRPKGGVLKSEARKGRSVLKAARLKAGQRADKRRPAGPERAT